MSAYDDDHDEDDDGRELKFDCRCGRELSVPVEMVGSVIECPWCLMEVRVPGGADDEAPDTDDEPSDAPPADAEPARCPSCAALVAEERCPSCGIDPLPAEDWELLPYAEDQRVVSSASADWLLRRARWLLSKQTREEFFARPLLLPTEEFFPQRWAAKLSLLEELVARMQKAAGLADCPVQVRVKDEVTSLDAALPRGVGVGGSFAAGCIYAPQWTDGVARIRVERNELEDRLDLVATLAHELGHLFGFVRLRCAEAPPLDNEPLTDLISTLHSGGYFACEASHRFVNKSLGMGWHIQGWNRSGYLSQPELSFALALFLAIREIPFDTVSRHLSLNPREWVRQSLRFFDLTPDAVREVASVLR